MVGVQTFLGIPIKSAIAMDNAAALGTQLGIVSETPQRIAENKKLVLWMMLPITLGGVAGTYLLLHVSSVVIKYLIVGAVLLVLIHTYIAKHKTYTGKITKAQYGLVFIFMLIIGAYSNFMGVGEGTFSKFALVSVLGLTFLTSQGLGAAAGIPARIYSLVVTALAGLIVWPYVLTFWVATFIAGKYSTRFVKKLPDSFLRAALTIMSIVFVVYLLFFY